MFGGKNVNKRFNSIGKIKKKDLMLLFCHTFYIFLTHSFMIKTYINANNMNAKIFYLNKYDHEGHKS